MTDERVAPAELLDNGSDHDLLREMIGYVAQRVMEMDVDGVVGAGHGERTEERMSSKPAIFHRGPYRPSGSGLAPSDLPLDWRHRLRLALIRPGAIGRTQCA